MNAPGFESDLIFGTLALRTGLVSRETLAAASGVQGRDGPRPLAQVLVDRGALAERGRSALGALAAEHVRVHGGDPVRSLASFDTEAMGSWAPEGRPPLPPDDGPGRTTLADTVEGPPPGLGETRDSPGPGQGPPPRPGPAGVRYRILRFHARGGLGDVFVAFDEELKREVALKQVREKNAHDPLSRSRFVAEAEITGHLEHPGVVPVHGLGCYDDGRPYYAMRFIRGVSLAAAIEQFHAARPGPGPGGDLNARSLEFRKLLRRFLDACDAVSYAHSRGVLHRDLKPDNIMLGKYGETLVVDWGLAKLIDAPESSDYGAEAAVPRSSDSGSHVTVNGSAMGTPAYMSPEQAAGEIDRLGPASDVYSLGATLYVLLVNRPPFVAADGDDAEALVGRARRGDFPHPRAVRPDAPRALEAVCLKAMALDPAARYPSPRALADDVERWLADAPVTAWREPPSVRAGRWVARNRSMMATAGAVIVVALIAAGFLALAESRADLKLAQANRRLQAVNRLAMEAVRAYYAGVSEDLLLKQPQFEALRNRLLRTPLEFYRRLQAVTPAGRDADPQARADLGEACLRVAAITDQIGVKDDALASYRVALAIFDRLSSDYPDNLSYRAARAECLDGLGAVEYATGSPAAALRSRRAALALWRGLAGAHPADLKFRSAEAACLKTIGQVESDSGDDAAALREYFQAREILEALLRDHHEEFGLRSELVSCLNRIASVQVSSRSMAEALESIRQALAQLPELRRAPREEPRFRYDEATCYRSVGWLECRAGRVEDGLKSFRQAHAILAALVRDHPAITQFRIDLASCQLRTAWSLHRLKRLDEATKEATGALEITREAVRLDPNVPEYRSHLAWCLGELASIDEAAGRPERALQSYRDATDICETLAKEHHHVSDYKQARVQGLINIGRVLGAVGRWAEARGSLEAARAESERWARDRPGESDVRALASEALAELAAALVVLKYPWDEVREVARQSAEHQRAVFEKAPQSVWYRQTLSQRYRFLASVYRNLGRPDRAVSTALKCRDLWAGNAPELFATAVNLARCVSLPGHAGDSLTPAEQDERRKYADLAVETLRMATEAGFQDLDRLRTAPELAPLRTTEEFKRLVSEVSDRVPSAGPLQRERSP